MESAREAVVEIGGEVADLIFLVMTMLLLSGILPNIPIRPASAISAIPPPVNQLFGPGIEKVMVHVNGADKGEVSPYYHTYLSGYRENGYDSVLYNMDHNLLTIEDEEPYNGGFESMTSLVEKTSSSVSGQYIVEQSSTQHLAGNNALHIRANVAGGTLGYAEIYQDMLWEIAPVAADLNLKFSIYPVSLTDVNAAPNSLITVQLNFTHYDSATTVPKMFLVLQDDPSESLSGTSFVNDTNNVYYVLNKQTPL